MSWEVRFERGISLPQIGWRLDAQEGSARAIVTHAHSDHIARHREVICTPATARLMRERLGPRHTTRELPYFQSEQLDLATTLTLLPAGHILGSAMVRFENLTHGSLLYTGDYKLRPSHAAERCTPAPADILIMETTFGLPKYVFPPDAEIEASLIEFCRSSLGGGATPVLYAYALGKTQELLRIVGAAGLPVMLAPAAYRLTRVYEELGEKMPAFFEFDQRRHSGHVVITPPGAPLLDWINPKRTAAVTGWALDPGTRYRYRADAVFPLSDHADFPQLLAFVDMVRPRIVYTVHGFTREFAATLRARGIEAWALGRGNQLELSL